MVTHTYPLTFYNLQVGRDPRQVRKEIRALLASRPAVLGLCEATGYDLPAVVGYRLLRDTSTPRRANVAAYVRVRLEVGTVRWADLKATWGRTQHPGAHESRSMLEFSTRPFAAVVAHQPPKGTDNTRAAQAEGIDHLTYRLAPWTRGDWDTRSPAAQALARHRPRLVLWDANRRPGEEGPGPTELARRIGGWTAGSDIDGAVFVGEDAHATRNARYVRNAGTVRLGSDHRHAFRCDLLVEA